MGVHQGRADRSEIRDYGLQRPSLGNGKDNLCPSLLGHKREHPVKVLPKFLGVQAGAGVPCSCWG